MFIARVNQQDPISIVQDKNEYEIDGEKVRFDFIRLSSNKFHLLLNQHSFEAELLEINRNTKTFSFDIDGRNYRVTLEDDFDILLDKMGIKKGSDTLVREIVAPMPGLVLKVDVQSGDTVLAGDSLVVLEAMKMENIIKAPNDAVVSVVHVEDGQKIDKNTLLISFE